MRLIYGWVLVAALVAIGLFCIYIGLFCIYTAIMIVRTM